MRSTMIAVLTLIPTVAFASIPEGVSPNWYLQQQFKDAQSTTNNMSFDTCIEIAGDLAHSSPYGFETEEETENLYVVKVFEENNRILRVTCYNGQIFMDRWTQGAD